MDKVQQIGAELFKFTFSSPKKDLLIEPGVRMNLTSFKFEAPEKASQISMLLRKKIKGKKLMKVYQHNNDRIIVFEFNNFKLITEFFSHGNFVLTDDNFKILFTFRKEVWKDRELKKGVVYKFPSNVIKIKKDFSPVSEKEFNKFNSINKALDEFYVSQKKENKKLSKLRHRLKQQHETLEKYEKKAFEYTSIGDKIYENYQKIDKILNSNKEKLTKLGVERKGKKLVLDLN